jgi:hypothetical protein
VEVGIAVHVICLSRLIKATNISSIGGVKLFLCLTNWARRHEGVCWSGCIDPHFLDLGTSWRWVVSFTSRPLYPQRKSPVTPLDRRLGWPKSWSGHCGENSLPYRDSNSDPSVVQSVVSRYTNYAIPAPILFQLYCKNINTYWPITVVAQCKPRNVFGSYNTGIIGSNPTRDMDVSVLPCVGSSLAMGWSPSPAAEGVPPTVCKIHNLIILKANRPERLIRQGRRQIYIYKKKLTL